MAIDSIKRIGGGGSSTTAAAVLYKLVTHAELVTLATGGTLEPGMKYGFVYTAKWIDPADGATVRTATTTETLVVDAISTTKLSQEAFSVDLPADYIEIDALDTANGSTGVIKFRRDANGNEAFFDWRNVTFRRYNVTGMVHTAATFKLEADGVTASTTRMTATVPTPTHVYGPGRYAEAALQLPTTHGANPTLHVIRSGYSASTEIVDKPLLNIDGTAFAANALGTLSADGLFLVMFSVALDAFQVVSNTNYNNLVKGYVGYKPSNTRLGADIDLVVDTAVFQEKHCFGSRTPTCKNVKIGPHPSRLPNVVITDATGCIDLKILAGSEDTTLAPVTAYPMVAVSGKMVRSILSGLVSESSFGNWGIQECFIHNADTLNYHNPLCIQHTPNLNHRNLMMQSTVMLGNRLNINASGLNKAVLQITYGFMRYATFRAYNMVTVDLAVQTEDVDLAWFNIRNLWNNVKFNLVQGQAYEFAASRQKYEEWGTTGTQPAKSHRDTKFGLQRKFLNNRQVNSGTGAGYTLELNSGTTEINMDADSAITLKGGMQHALYTVQIFSDSKDGIVGFVPTFPNLVNAPTLPGGLNKYYVLMIRAIGKMFYCEYWFEAPNQTEAIHDPMS